MAGVPGLSQLTQHGHQGIEKCLAFAGSFIEVALIDTDADSDTDPDGNGRGKHANCSVSSLSCGFPKPKTALFRAISTVPFI